MATDLQRRPITVDEYHQMVRIGILDEDERVELLDGDLVLMPPLGEAHILAHTAIVRYLIEALPAACEIAGQVSVPLGRISEPQPDVVIFHKAFEDANKGEWNRFVIATIEISDSSLRRDSGAKLRTYARNGIKEYLIVDLGNDRILRHRWPAGDIYSDVQSLHPGEQFSLDEVPDVSLEVAGFIPKRR